jgi:aldehyde dehydrogenase (NAD+)
MAGKAADVKGESSLQTPGFVNMTFRQPYGVCGAIIPWNAPVTALTFKLAPALLAGNTMVAKSSEKAPLTSLFIGKLIMKAGFPPGVVNILSGTGVNCGSTMASHMDIRKISFTGSVQAGRAIRRAAADSNMKHITLELGGKSPLIIFEDADIEKAATASAFSILYNSGQVCIASTRVYVHSSILDQFCRLLVAAVGKMGTNPTGHTDPRDKRTIRGPQADKRQFDIIQKYLLDSKSAGHKVLTGGSRDGDQGFYIQPTVILNPAENSAVMREEIFGPVVCVRPFDTEEEVLILANDSEYGLYASTFTKDISRALRIAKGLESGTVGINCTSPMMTHDMPFGGVKQSGEGRELGAHALDDWTELKTVYICL